MPVTAAAPWRFRAAVRGCLGAGAAWAAAGTAAAQTTPGGPVRAPHRVVEIEALREMTPEARRVIAELFQPKLVELGPGQDPLAAAAALCGAEAVADPAFRAELERQNGGPSGLSPAPSARRLSVPACLEQPRPTARTAPPAPGRAGAPTGSSQQALRTVTERAEHLWNAQRQLADQQAAVATALPQVADAIRRIQPGTGGGVPPPGLNAPAPSGAGGLPDLAQALSEQVERVRQGQDLLVRQTGDLARDAAALAGAAVADRPVPPQSLPLRPGVRAEDAVASLAAALPAAAPRAASGLSLIVPLASGAPEVAGTPCAAEQPPATWPIDAAGLAEAVSIAVKTAEERGQQPVRAVIRVADTGIRGLGGFVPLPMLAVDPGKPSPDQNVPEENRPGGRFGFAAEGERASLYPYPLVEDRFHWHGTQVADLAMGGGAFRERMPTATLARLIGLNFAKLSSRRLGGTILIEGLALQDAFSHEPVPTVLNASVGSQDRLGNFVGTADSHRGDTLVVVAAGNQGDDIGDTPVFPASYGGAGDLRRILITVGAHDPSLARARFSNRSERYVDLLAPGCAMRFRFGGEPEAVLHGTSFAAPLVSLTAGLVRALGVRRADAAKRHILRTADFDPTLERDVSSSGRLNAAKAVLTVFHDVAQRRDGSLVAGEWLNRSVRVPCGPHGIVRLSTARSVSLVRRDGEAERLRVLAEDALGDFEPPITCPAPPEQVRFRPLGGGEEVGIAWAELSALVPAALPR